MLLPRSYSYESMVQPYQHDLYRYCINITGSVWDGEDLYQETMLKSLRYYNSTDNNSEGVIKNVRSFLYLVARNLWIDEYRSRKRKQITEITSQIELSDINYPEIREIVEWLASRLSDRYIEVWLLAEYFGFTMNEIAERLHLTMPSVRSALHRARLKLRACHHEAIDSKPPGKLKNSGNVAEPQIEHWVRCIMQDNPFDLGKDYKVLLENNRLEWA